MSQRKQDSVQSKMLLLICLTIIISGVASLDCISKNRISIDEKDFVSGATIPGVQVEIDTSLSKNGDSCPDFLQVLPNGTLSIKNAFNIDLILKGTQSYLECSYMARCSARTQGQQVDIFLNDENDEPPYFDPNINPQIVIDEMLPINIEFISFKGKLMDDDFDDRTYLDLMTLVLKTDSLGFFKVDGRNKTVMLIKNLDYELGERMLNLSLTIMDRGGHESEPFAMSVLVRDGDDQPPVFSRSHYNIDTDLKNWNVNGCLSTVPEMIAYDGDVTLKALVKYTIVEVNGHSQGWPFDMNCTQLGQFRLLRSIEASENTYFHVTVKATQLDAPDRAAYSYVLLSVQPPLKMSKDVYEVRIQEGLQPGSHVLIVNVVEYTKTSNLTFALNDPSGSFELLHSNGLPFASIVVSNQASIDRETKDLYNMTVRCHAEGVGIIESSITIYITDVNDNAPTFKVNATELLINIQEGELGPDRDILTVDVEDIDLGNNGNLSLYLEGDAKLLFILSTTQSVGGKVIVSVRPKVNLTSRMPEIPRTAKGKAVYTFSIVADDQGTPILTARFKVRILIRPPEPIVTNKVYAVSLQENHPGNRTLVQVGALHDDGENVVYIVGAGNEDNTFNVEPLTGNVQILRPLDREIEPMRILQVKALWGDDIDGRHAPQLYDDDQSDNIALVVISVLDVNEAPYFSKNFSAITLADIPVGTTVASVNAQDPDSSGTNNSLLTYKLIAGKSNSPFDINSATGEVRTIALLPKEARSYEIEVCASDRGNPTLNGSTWLTVRVVTREDAKLMFSNSIYYVNVSEGISIGSSIFSVNATVDGKFSGDINYTIAITGAPFSMISGLQGEMITNGTIDREKRAAWELLVIAQHNSSSGLLTAFTQVVVTVTDINDNDPTFYCKNGSAEILEGNYTLKLIANVTAFDIDEGENARIKYRLTQGNEDAAFIIIEGLVFVNGSLDYEVRTNYTLTVEALDGGQLPRSSTIEVLVKVLDVNDNCPFFDKKSTPVAVPEHISWLAVANFSATDLDRSLAYSQVGYELGDEEMAQDFYLDQQRDRSVVLRVTTGLQYSLRENYEISIWAYDLADPLCRSEERLYLTVLRANATEHANDSRPSFEKIIYRLPVPWNAINGSCLDQIKARSSSALVYRIIDGNEGKYFILDSANGTLCLAVNASELGRKTFTITVVARTVHDANLYASTVVQIRLSHPLFSDSIFKAHVTEGEKCSMAVQLVAEPFDNGSGVRYSIISGNEGDDLYLDENTGRLSCARVLDRETRSFYSIMVKAEQATARNPKMTGDIGRGYDIAVVHMWVSDVNDNDPDITSALEFYISGASTQGQAVATIEARDLDECQNITFVITNDAEEKGLFSINSNGTISLQGSHISRPVNKLEVTAFDNCDAKSRQTSKIVTIIVSSPNVITPTDLQWFSITDNDINSTERSLGNLTGLDIHISRSALSPTDPNKLRTSIYATKDGLYVKSEELLSKLTGKNAELGNSDGAVARNQQQSDTTIYVLAGVASAFALISFVALALGCRWRRRLLTRIEDNSPLIRNIAAEEGSRSDVRTPTADIHGDITTNGESSSRNSLLGPRRASLSSPGASPAAMASAPGVSEQQGEPAIQQQPLLQQHSGRVETTPSNDQESLLLPQNDLPHPSERPSPSATGNGEQLLHQLPLQHTDQLAPIKYGISQNAAGQQSSQDNSSHNGTVASSDDAQNATSGAASISLQPNSHDVVSRAELSSFALPASPSAAFDDMTEPRQAPAAQPLQGVLPEQRKQPDPQAELVSDDPNTRL